MAAGNVTMEMVRAALDPDEPDYAAASALGPDALPLLSQLVGSGDSLLASKAAYLASLIQGGMQVVQSAAASNDPIVRVAAAAALTNVSGGAVPDQVLQGLLADADVGVRKAALQSIAANPGANPNVRSMATQIAANDADPYIKQLAGEVVSGLPSDTA